MLHCLILKSWQYIYKDSSRAAMYVCTLLGNFLPTFHYFHCWWIGLPIGADECFLSAEVTIHQYPLLRDACWLSPLRIIAGELVHVQVFNQVWVRKPRWHKVFCLASLGILGSPSWNGTMYFDERLLSLCLRFSSDLIAIMHSLSSSV